MSGGAIVIGISIVLGIELLEIRGDDQILRLVDLQTLEIAHTVDTDPAAECTGMVNLFAIDDDWGVDACTGLPCDDADYPFPKLMLP